MGKIISLKLGRRFCPDYRRNRISTYFPLPLDAKKILIVDDRMDYGDTFDKCVEDILHKTHPYCDSETIISTKQIPSDIKFFPFLISGDAPFNPHYHLYESLDYEFPWGKYHPNPLKNDQFRRSVVESGQNWLEAVIALLDELADKPAPATRASYQNRPLSDEILVKFTDQPGQIIYTVRLEEKIDESNFLDTCNEHRVIVVGEQSIIERENKGNSFRYYLDGAANSIKLVFRGENLRTLGDMCGNCELRKQNEKGPLCLTCNNYVRSLDLLAKIYYVLKKRYKVKKINAEISNAVSKVDVTSKIMEDLKRKNSL